MKDTKVFYIWECDGDGGYSACDKDSFNTQHQDGLRKEAIFEYSDRNEFVSRFIENFPDDKDSVESIADEYCSNFY